MNNICFVANTKTFCIIPGCPFAYWISKSMRELFNSGETLDNVAVCCTGMQTGNNEKYIRLWHEVPFVNTQINNSRGKWYRYNCGGPSRKWYGNHFYMVNWDENGKEIKSEKSSVIRNEKYYFHPGISWKRIGGDSFAMRFLPQNFIFDQAGDSMFLNDESQLLYLLAFVNSVVAYKISEFIAPTMNLTAGNMNRLPIIKSNNKSNIDYIVETNIDNCKTDWDSFETSWDFKKHPLI